MATAPPSLDWNKLDDTAVDTVRLLAADAVEKAGNGHPGTAMSLAPAAYLLYQKIMRHDPADPLWPGRDRFVLSCGHSSLTQYIQLFLAGYPMTLDDLKALRTWGSQTPGHPEHAHTPGVEVTTGPLGQGIGNAVGMAMAARRERGLLDPDTHAGDSVFDHQVYVFASDGDLQEGVSSEASSLAGHQRLGNLTVLYDDNQISIEDDTDVAFSENVAQRYEAYGWHVQRSTGRTAAPATTRMSQHSTTPTPRPATRPTAPASSCCAPSSRGRPPTRATPAPPMARRSEPTRSPPPSGSSASTRTSRSPSPTRCWPTPGRPATAAPAPTPSGSSSSTHGRPSTATRRRSSTA